MKKNLHNTISIVTPSLNQGDYIEETIKSVIDQAGEFFIDYIIADGGSRDRTVEIIKKWEDQINNKKFKPSCQGIELRWWSKKDKGQADAINQGFAAARGEIFAWINSDDFYEPNIFSKVLNEFNNDPELALLYGGGRFIDGDGKELMVWKPIELTDEILIRRLCQIFQPSTFFTKNIFNQAGGFDLDLHYAFDYDLWIRIARLGKLKHYEEIFSNFREWPESKGVTQKEKFIEEERIIFKRYGGNIIDDRYIQKFRPKMFFLDWLKKLLPGPYALGKKLFYFLIDHIRYKEKKK